jgi:hypothetical protein
VLFCQETAPHPLYLGFASDWAGLWGKKPRALPDFENDAHGARMAAMFVGSKVFQLSRFPPIYQSIPENLGFLVPATVLHRGFFLTRPRPAVYIPPPKDETATMPDGK